MSITNDNGLVDPYDVPEEFKEHGWRKCYSRREKRYYYFNKITQESFWSLNDLYDMRDFKRDPLGIFTPSPSPASTITHQSLSPNNHLSLTQQSLTPLSDYSSLSSIGGYHRLSTHSDDYELHSLSSPSSPKRMAFNHNNSNKFNYWDFKCETNVVVNEHAMSLQLPPHPDIELMRHGCYSKLKCEFMSLIKTLFKDIIDFKCCDETINGENESNSQSTDDDKHMKHGFESIFECLAIEYLILNDYLAQNEQLLFKFDLDNDYLKRSCLVKHLTKLIDQQIMAKCATQSNILYNYEAQVKDIIRKLLDDLNDEQLVNSCLNALDKDIGSWLKWCKKYLINENSSNNSNSSSSSISSNSTNSENTNDNESNCVNNNKEYLNKLKKKCELHIIDALLKNKLVKLINEHNKFVDNCVNDMSCECNKLYEEKKIKILTEPPEYKKNRPVNCYPLILCTPSLYLPEPQLEHVLNESMTHLTYNNERLSIKTDYFAKLEVLYKVNCKDDEKKFHLFLARVWCLLKRYQVFTNDVANDETSSPVDHENELVNYETYALSSNVIDFIKSRFHVRLELFSNPFQCYFKQYCSLFTDTDGYFGGLGSFSNLKPITGSFMATLPYSLNIIHKFYQYIINLLDNSREPQQQPLSYLVVMPVTHDKTIIDKFINSKYCQTHFKIAKSANVELRKVSEYCKVNRQDCMFKCQYDLLFILIQNEAAKHKWPIYDDDVEQLKNEILRDSSNQLSYSP